MNQYWIRFCYHFDDINTTQSTSLIKCIENENKHGFSMPSNSQTQKLVHRKIHTTTGWSWNSGLCFDFCYGIDLWIGPCYPSLDIDPVVQEAQLLNLFSVLSQILGSCPAKITHIFQIWIQLSNFWASHKSFFSDVGALCVLFGWH
jgi:hypothetical protein